MTDLEQWLTLFREWDDAADPSHHLLVFADALEEVADWRGPWVRKDVAQLLNPVDKNQTPRSNFQDRLVCRFRVLAMFTPAKETRRLQKEMGVVQY